MLRSRRARREDYVGSWLPEPVVSLDESTNPEDEALIADSVGLALLVVLDTLTPSERLAFVLHDMFAVPFDEIGAIVGRSPDAARQLASRARRRVRGRRERGRRTSPAARAGRRVSRRIARRRLRGAGRGARPRVVFRADTGPGSRLARPPVEGAEPVARRVLERGRPLAVCTAGARERRRRAGRRTPRPTDRRGQLHDHPRPHRRHRPDHRPRKVARVTNNGVRTELPGQAVKTASGAPPERRVSERAFDRSQQVVVGEGVVRHRARAPCRERRPPAARGCRRWSRPHPR